MSEPTIAQEAAALLARLGVDTAQLAGGDLAVRSPIDGSLIASLRTADGAAMTAAIDRAQAAFLAWRQVREQGKLDWSPIDNDSEPMR